MGVTLRN